MRVFEELIPALGQPTDLSAGDPPTDGPPTDTR
jgi:hypothetical protein